MNAPPGYFAATSAPFSPRTPAPFGCVAPSEEDPARTQIVGEVDLAYAEQLRPGDRFVLEGRCLEFKQRTGEALEVDEVFGRPLVPPGWATACR